jgi:integrase
MLNLRFDVRGQTIETSGDWSILESVVRSTLPKSSHLNMALKLLGYALLDMQKNSRVLDIKPLLQYSERADAVVCFSESLSRVVATFGWPKCTAHKIVTLVRKILNLTTIKKGFSKAIRFTHSQDRSSDKILGRVYGQIDHPERKVLEEWVVALRKHTSNKSEISLRGLLRFYLNSCLPVFGVLLKDWPVAFAITDEQVKRICGGVVKKYKWLQTWLTFIAKVEYKVNPELVKAAHLCAKQKKAELVDQGDNTDFHRISSVDLDKIYVQSKKKGVRSELMYLLLISTGMRVGGLVKIRTKNVTEAAQAHVVPKETGRTLEKGNKWFSFCLLPRIKELLVEWISSLRSGDAGPYLFPGRVTGHVTTKAVRTMFSGICHEAGLEGVQFHPHALRHSYAHILLENGNTPEIVSKLLNHANVATTEQFYLRENTMQVLKRANIPWLADTDKCKEPLPNFLQSVSQSTQKQSEAKKRRIGLMKQQLADLL